ncbi:nuclear pore complex protein Nup205 [Neolamprologus brichardi]|nr:nuclear pore complex protein Nup205 [Neolamprologus brichardi]
MAAQMAVNSGASLWGPLKELWETVDGAVLRRQPESVHLLDLQLKKHKPHFLSLFKNPPKSAEQREKVRKASTEGIAIQGQQGSRLLPEQLLTEAFILSDLFDIGELAALELLLAGEQQQPYFPGLTRGLVAVLLYWDGKLCMANSLRTLIQSRQGKTFTLDLSGELVALTTRFTDELMSQGLSKRILTLVSEISVTREFERLQKERGLGNEKHRKEVADLIKECRQALADSLFSWTCQSPLSKDDTLALIGHLETVTAQADGSLDSVSLALVMALLYCLDVSFIEQGTEDRDDLLQALPLLTERQYVSAVHSRLMDSQPWKLPGLQAVCRLAWALLLRVLSQLPQGSALVEFTEADEALADQALLGDVFLFMKEGILGCESFSQEEFYIRRVHSLITDFLALMPMKVKQLRNRADEDARLVHMSLQMDSELPSSLRKDLDHLMILVSDNIQGVSGSPVSWEHFFHSLMLYHENLRRDLPNPDSAHYRHPPLRGITQREMEGLTSFLQLLTTIITWSENARLALCEHPQWTPVVVMLGLLQCSVPPVLKAELLHCLAAFGKSPEIAASLWQSLEYTQILQTVRAPGQRQAAGIEGHSIMFHLLNDSPMLALCLSLLEEGVRQLDTYAPFPGKKHLESAVLHCLCLLDLALQKEAVFMDLLRESQASLLVSPLEQLLQGVSPQTRRADHIVNIARYLYHSSSNPEAAFQSAKILRRIANYPNIQIRLVGDFTHDQAVSDKLMAGFVECLDNEDAEEGTEKDDVDSQKKVARIRHETQIHILNLLITSLELKAPNLALYLLGYEVKKPVSSTNLQDPGVLGCPRSCLHAILSRLQRGTEKRSGPALTQQAPHLAELCYQVIYQLCACPDTSGPTMRYLRTSQDFLFSHLQHLPFLLPSNQIAALSQMSWLMKTAAIELRVTSLNRQRSHTQRLVSLLLDDQPHAQHADGESGMEDETRSVSGFLHFDTVSKVRRKLLSVLDAIEFSQDMPELLQLDFFERTQIEQVISNCEHVNEQGHTVCNVKLLHRVLVAEVNALQGMAAIGQRPLLMEEVNSILQQVVERNRVRRSLSAKRHALQSWRSLVETLLTACPADLISADERQLIIRDLLLDLHDKVSDHVSVAVISSPVQSGTGLRGGYQRLRAHLYGSLLYYLQIAQKPEEPDTLQTAGKAMWERLTAPEDGFSKLQRENLAIIESYGKALMEVVCRDACDGHEISRMLAMAVLDRILSIDRQNQWLLYICNSGYLRSLVESLRQDDVALQSLLTPQPPLLKPLYIFESKMALLTRVAKTGEGAVELLRCGLVAQLMECQVFDMVPDSDAHRVMRDPSGFIPSPMDRYRQILLPTLRLFQVILTSTSINHQQGAAQVLQWLIVHADTIQSLLRCQELSMGALQELSLLTGIISKTALPGALEMGGEVNSAALLEFQGHINRFQRLCLSLLGRLAGSERDRLLKQAEISAPGDSAERREEMEVAMQQVCANIMEYCQALLLQSSAQAQFSICLFSPSGSEPAGRDGARTDLSSTVPSMAYSRVPSLGLVLYLLKNSAADFFRFHQSHRQSLGKLQSLDQLPPEELKELCQGLVSGPGGVEKISSVQRSLLAKRRLVQLINNRAKLLALCSYVIETCLFVLWRHLEYYLLHCIPTDPKDSLLPGSTLYRSRLADDSFSGLQASGGRGLSLSRVSQQDLDLLKSDMAAGFGEALQRKLLEVEGSYSQVRSRYTFIQALVRRIRGLLRQPKS